MTFTHQLFLIKWAGMARRVLPSLAEIMANRAAGAAERFGPWRAGAKFTKPLVLLRGGPGTFWARHAGYSTLGQIPTAMFHAVEDIPGVAARGTSFGAHQLEPAGFKMPKVIPFETWANLQPQ